MMVIGPKAGEKRKEMSEVKKEWRAENADHLKQYYAQNADHLKQDQKKYRERPENVALRAERAADVAAAHRSKYEDLLAETEPGRAFELLSDAEIEVLIKELVLKSTIRDQFGNVYTLAEAVK